MTETVQIPEQELDAMSHLEMIINGWVAKSNYQKDMDWYQKLKEQYE
jgi:hypothetical protein